MKRRKFIKIVCSCYVVSNLMPVNFAYSNNPKNIIKVDDTQIGIMEGKNAGCITVGVYQWSTYMKICEIDKEYSLSDEEMDYKMNDSRNILSEVKPDFLIGSLDELPRITSFLNRSK